MKYITLITNLLLTIMFSQTAIGQIDHAVFFTVSFEDKKRWNSYDQLVNMTTTTTNAKLDSITKYANNEFQLGQYSKCVELCELAESMTMDRSELYLLKGKAFVSSSNSCKIENGHDIKEEVIWAAMDEWAKIKPNSQHFKKANILMERYKKYLPTQEDFNSCFGPNTIEEGGEYFINCWIMKNVKIRLRKFE